MSDYQLNRAHDAARRQMEGSMKSEARERLTDFANFYDGVAASAVFGAATIKEHVQDIRQLLDENARLGKDNVEMIRTLAFARRNSTNPNGATIVDFQNVWLDQKDKRIAELEAALAAKDAQQHGASGMCCALREQERAAREQAERKVQNLMEFVQDVGVIETHTRKDCAEFVREQVQKALTNIKWKLDTDQESAQEAQLRTIGELMDEVEQAQAACAAYRQFISTEMTWLDFRDDMLKTASGKNARKLEAWLEKHGMTNAGQPILDELARLREALTELAEYDPERDHDYVRLVARAALAKGAAKYAGRHPSDVSGNYPEV